MFLAVEDILQLMNAELSDAMYILPSGSSPTFHILSFSNATRMRGENMTSLLLVQECVMRRGDPSTHEHLVKKPISHQRDTAEACARIERWFVVRNIVLWQPTDYYATVTVQRG